MVGRCACDMDIILRLFLLLFKILNLVVFQAVYRQCVSCVQNTSCNFISIVLKLGKCFCHGLKICIGSDIIFRLIFVVISAF